MKKDYSANIHFNFPRQADVMIGGLYETPATREYLRMSSSYYEDDTTFCVARADHAPKWQNVFNIFTPLVWILVKLSLVFSAVVLYCYARLVRKSKNNFWWSFFNTCSIIINGIDYLQSKRTFYRLFIAFSFFYWIHIRVAYQSSLLKSFKNPRYDHQIDTVEKGIEANFTFTGLPNIPEMLLTSGKADESFSRYFETCQNMTSCLLALKTNKKLAVIASRLRIKNTLLPLTEKHVFCFAPEHNLQSYSISMLFRKYFHLISKINMLIGELNESGLVAKWVKESGRLRGYDHGIRSSEELVIKMEHMQGVFMLMIAGCFLSIMGFVCEKVFYWFSTDFKKSYAEYKRQKENPTYFDPPFYVE